MRSPPRARLTEIEAIELALELPALLIERFVVLLVLAFVVLLGALLLKLGEHVHHRALLVCRLVLRRANVVDERVAVERLGASRMRLGAEARKGAVVQIAPRARVPTELNLAPASGRA